MTAAASSAHEGLLSNMAVMELVLRDTPQVFCVFPGPYHVRKPAQTSYDLLSCMRFRLLESQHPSPPLDGKHPPVERLQRKLCFCPHRPLLIRARLDFAR